MNNHKIENNNELLTTIAMVQLALEELNKEAFNSPETYSQQSRVNSMVDKLDACIEYLDEILIIDEE